MKLHLMLNYEMGGSFIWLPKQPIPPELKLTDQDRTWGVSDGKMAGLIERHPDLEITLTRYSQ